MPTRAADSSSTPTTKRRSRKETEPEANGVEGAGATRILTPEEVAADPQARALAAHIAGEEGHPVAGIDAAGNVEAPKDVAVHPVERDEQVYTIDGSGPFRVTGICPGLFDADGNASESGVYRHVRLETTDGSTEVPEHKLTRQAPGSTPDIDPLADEDPAWKQLAPNVLGDIAGLFHGGKEITSYRVYMEQMEALGFEKPSLGAAKLACDDIAKEIAVPGDFVLPEQPQEPDEETRRILQQAADEADAEVAKRKAARDARTKPRATGRHIVGRKAKDVEKDLDDLTLLARGRALAKLHGEIANEKARHAQVKAELKEAMLALEGERARLSSVVETGKEVVTVHVLLEADFDDGVVREILEGTDTVVGSRPIDEKERQMTLFPLDRATANAAAAEAAAPADTPPEPAVDQTLPEGSFDDTGTDTDEDDEE